MTNTTAINNNPLAEAVTNLYNAFANLSEAEKQEMKLTVPELLTKYNTFIGVVALETSTAIASSMDAKIFDTFGIDYTSEVIHIYEDGRDNNWTMEEVSSKLIGRLSGRLFEAMSAKIISGALASQK